MGKNDSGMPAITVGTDFRGKTSSAEGRPPLAGRAGRVFSGIVEVTSSIVASASVSSRDMVDLEVSGSLWPKHPSKISSKNEVLVPARAISTFPRPLHLNLAAVPSRCAANSNKVRP